MSFRQYQEPQPGARIKPTGNTPNDLMLIAKAPLWDELISKRPISGKGGQELWTGFDRRDIPGRSDWYCTSLIKVGIAKGKDVKASDVDDARLELLDEIELVNPRLIVTFGALVTRVFLDVPISWCHGIGHNVTFAGKARCVFPMFDPGSGLQNKSFLSVIGYDLDRLQVLLKEMS